MEDPSIMIQVAGYCVAAALLCIVVGLPLTAVRRTSWSRPLDTLFDAFATGLVVLLVGFSVLNWLGGIWFGLLAAALLAAIGATLARQGFAGFPPLRWRPDPWVVVTAAVLAGATAIRLRSVNYISRGGDYGGYVNWANQYGRTGVLTSGFPPLFSMFLGLTSRVFGPAHTTATVPLLGVLLLLATLRLLGQLEVRAVVKVAALVFVALHTHAVWYSSFPMSEALQAPLVVLLLSNLVAICHADRDHQPVGELVTLGLIALAIGLCRVTAPVLVLPMVVLVAASAVRPWRSLTSRLAAATAATTVGVTVGYLYGLTEIRPYYVGNQIRGTLPASVVDKLDRFGLLEVTPALVGLAAGAVLLLVALAWLTRPGSQWVTGPEGEAAEPEPTDPWWWPLPLGVVLLVAGKVVADTVPGSDVNGQIHRIGYPLVVLAGLALLVPRALRRARGVTVIFGAIIGLVMVNVNVSRFDTPLNHTHFIYWDRYLFSELFPMLVLIVALGATGLLEWTSQRWPDGADGRPSVATVVVGLVPLVLASTASLVTLGTVRAMNYQETLDHAYELERDIVALMPDADAPVLWTANTRSKPANFPFPNTWYALGVPLTMTWGRDVVNVDPSRKPFEPEVIVGASEVAETVACSAGARAYVVEIDTGGPPLPARVTDRRLEVEDLGTTEYRIPFLAQPRGVGWLYSDVKAHVYQVTGQVAPTAPCPSPA